MTRLASAPSCITATLIGVVVGVLAAVIFAAVVIGPFLVFGPWGLLVSAAAAIVLYGAFRVVSRRRQPPKP
jgi:predicted PurR-regulated permease PerM